MELVFGAFHGMMRAHYDGRVKLTDETLEGARSACRDAIAEPAAPAKVDKKPAPRPGVSDRPSSPAR